MKPETIDKVDVATKGENMQTQGEGVKKQSIFADVFYGWPLNKLRYVIIQYFVQRRRAGVRDNADQSYIM